MSTIEQIIKGFDKERLLYLMIRLSAFQLIGQRNNNGADSYWCPCCYESKDLERGYCSHTNSYMDDVDHKPDCDLNNLFKILYGD